MKPVTKRLEANGITLEYNLWAKDDAPTIVLLHGVTSSKESYDLMAPHLLDTYQVIALDQRGHGNSSKQGPYTFDNLIEDLRAVLDEEKVGKAVLVGGSFASVPVQQFALRYPERVDGLVLLDGGFFRIADFPGYDLAAFQASPPFTFESKAAMMEYVENAYGKFMSEFVAEQMQRELVDQGDGRYGFALPHEAYISYISEYATWDLQGILPQIAAPILVLYIENPHQPEERQAFQKQAIETYKSLANNAQFVLIEDGLHALMITNAEETAKLVDRFYAGERVEV